MGSVLVGITDGGMLGLSLGLTDGMGEGMTDSDGRELGAMLSVSLDVVVAV